MLYTNLVATLIKAKAVTPQNYELIIGEVLGKTRRSVHNKFTGKTPWTLPEMQKINEYFFSGNENLTKLFEK